MTDTGEQNKIRDPALTVREHLDPDKHWIGESLPAPTQSEIAATVGSTAGPGESPFPARADHTHKLGQNTIVSGNIANGVFIGISPKGPGVTLADDQAAYLNFGPAPSTGTQYGVVVFGTNTSSWSCMIGFRCGDTSGAATVIASASPALTNAGAGSLAGTSGTDGHFSFRASNTAAICRVYIENRTGGARVFVATFLSLASGTLPPGESWVIL